jgi:ubiquitin-like 1-activating enzyme E1 B
LTSFSAIAGNISPAIATTNAIIAGFIVLQAIIIITSGVKNCKTVF